MSDYDACPPQLPPPADVSFREATYKTFSKGPQGDPLIPPTPIKVDEYAPKPPWDPAGYPVLIQLHGGGFWRSCRFLLQEVAWEAVRGMTGPPIVEPLPSKFIVLNGDFRLPCKSDDPNLAESPILPLCDWWFTTADPPGSSTHGATIHDVQDLVRWVTSTWQHTAHPPWNGEIDILGGSSGGTYGYSAVAPPPGVGGAVSGVHAVAAWSGHMEMDREEVADSEGVKHWPCEYQQSDETAYIECQNATTHYLSPLCDPHVYPDPACLDLFTETSPISWYTSPPPPAVGSLPPAFFANGGGPYEGADNNNHQEVVALQSMFDFRDLLVRNLWVQNEDYEYCVINQTPGPPILHGRAIRNYPCNDPPSIHTVWYLTAEFLIRDGY